MPPTVESPEQTAFRCAKEIRDSLRRAKRRYLRYAIEIDDLRVTLGAKKLRKTIDPSSDLPPELKRSRLSVRTTYRAIRDIRSERGEDAEVWPSTIVAWLDARNPTTEHSIDTLNHALSDLRQLRLAWSPDPDSRDRRGWRLGSPQLTLPILAGQTCRPDQIASGGYAPQSADTFVGRLRSTSMTRRWIWVPGERDEESGAVVVTDARTDRSVGVTERTGSMQVPTRSGTLARVPAARGELVRTEGRYAVVKFGTQQLAVRVIDEWQLRGLDSPEPEETSPGAA